MDKPRQPRNHSLILDYIEPTGPRIPTLSKAQPPYQFCYPIGASVVTEAFLNLPQFPLFILSFSTNSPLMQPNWTIPGYPVLRLTYSSYPEYTPRTTSVRPRRLNVFSDDVGKQRRADRPVRHREVRPERRGEPG